jgi:hypothetical protein
MQLEICTQLLRPVPVIITLNPRQSKSPLAPADQPIPQAPERLADPFSFCHKIGRHLEGYLNKGRGNLRITSDRNSRSNAGNWRNIATWDPIISPGFSKHLLGKAHINLSLIGGSRVPRTS